MNKTLNKHEELKFKNNIAEISSISLECLYDVSDVSIEGNFVITGEYRSHEISLNKDNFEFKVPFSEETPNNIVTSSVLVNIDDFTYDISGDSLEINIDYNIKASEKEQEEVFEEREAFEKFLDEHEVDVVDLQEEEKTEEIIEQEEEEIPLEIEEPIILEDDDRNVEETIINSVDTSENTYITYHIHVVNDTDTLDSIAKKYNITIDTIREYNDSQDLKTGMKLVIPSINE